MEADAHQISGQVLNGRYRIERQLGLGGMGVVYQAVQLPLGRACALKLTHPRHAFGELADTVMRRFRREAVLGLQVQHEGLITIYDFDTLPDGTMYYAMELLSGRSLGEVLALGGQLPWQGAVELGLQAAQA